MQNSVKITAFGASPDGLTIEESVKYLNKQEVKITGVDLYLSRVPIVGEQIFWDDKVYQVFDVRHLPYSKNNPNKIAAIVDVKFIKDLAE